MSRDWQDDVRKFHKRCGQSIEITPTIPTLKELNLRIDLINEEINKELIPLLERYQDPQYRKIGNNTKDIAEITDGILDSIYVLLGTLIVFGVEAQPIWDEIQKSNMKKRGGGYREDGKVLKPKGWTPPDIQKLIQIQCGENEPKEKE